MKKSDTLLFTFPGNETLSENIVSVTGIQRGEMILRDFPDGESYVRILSNVKDKKIVVLCSLDRPDSKFLPLYFFCKTAKEWGAIKITLIAPYLGYMRQDKVFHQGEGITSTYFAKLLSIVVDELFTVDPHLHRHKSLSEIYTIPSLALNAAGYISKWIKEQVHRPVLIGPDSESEQWVAKVATDAGAPYIVLHKTRRGDRDVEVSVPYVEQYKEHIPVLVDDIVSTARTMIETVTHLKKAGMKAPICIGIHAIFAGNAYNELLDSGVERIVTCNTVFHESNGIDISDLFYSIIE